MVLRAHQRKKKHFQLNPANHAFDRFYLVNYVADKQQDAKSIDNDEGLDFEEWDDVCEIPCLCLFGCQEFPSAQETMSHMAAVHGFDLKALVDRQKGDDYTAIRLINYIRCKTEKLECMNCAASFSSSALLLDHYSASLHSRFIPDSKSPIWADPNYLFPWKDDDSLLFEC